MTRESVSNQKPLADWQWRAVESRNSEFDGVFYFGVRTTGIFCRPSCSSRQPKRRNVSFFLDPAEAEHAGFRACLRCKPKNKYFPGTAASLIHKAFLLLRTKHFQIAAVDQLSAELKVSPGHLQKTFKTMLGISPKAVSDLMRIEIFKNKVKDNDVTTSLYDSGFGSSRSLYEKAGQTLGMTPAAYKKGGKDMNIRYTISDSPLGNLLVAATEKGICAVSFGDDAKSLEYGLNKEFPAANITADEGSLCEAVGAILNSLDGNKSVLKLPLDIRATAFQMRVWSELQKIPFGETRSYTEIAENLGNPNAVRAVARACAANPVALITPCHRVIASDGKLSGYRWGIERKEQLLKHEKES